MLADCGLPAVCYGQVNRRSPTLKVLLTAAPFSKHNWRPAWEHSLVRHAKTRLHEISPALDNRLSLYGLAAGAACAALLAIPQRSQAEVVYTPADVKLNRDRIH